ncbi:MAG: MBL fold metallo-hydrolase RNA specificity domain-containing protein [Salinirussus sp.]
MNLRYGDGLRLDLPTGERIVADANRPGGDVAFVSHAHGDHLYREPPEAVVWSELTRDLAAVRRDGYPLPDRTLHPHIELFDAGHVPGSRAALIEAEQSVLYTGDVCTRDRLYLSGFDPPAADVLVMESTYGHPDYEFPPVEHVRDSFREWVADHSDRPILCFGYALGRAQEVEYLLGETDRDRILISDAIADLDAVIEEHLGIDLPGENYDSLDEFGAGDALVLPSRFRGGWVDDLIERTGAVTAGLSGWAIDGGFRFARDVDAAFVLSDHCDFTELVNLVHEVDPETVYTLHGSADDFAAYLSTEHGYDATALKRHQSRLSEF